MKKILFSLLTIALAITFVACDKKQYTTLPTFKGFEYTPNPLHAGDTLTISAVYDNRGENWGGPAVTYTLSLDTLNASTGDYDHAQISVTKKCSVSDEKLSASMVIPKSAKSQKSSCTFKVKFSNYADISVSSVANTTAPGYLGTFDKTTAGSALYSQCSGSLTVTIQ